MLLENIRSLLQGIVTTIRQSLHPRRRKSMQPGSAILVYQPRAGGGGVRPGVNLDTTSELLDLMDPPDAIAGRYRR